MTLAEYVMNQTNISEEQIIFLRHGSDRIKKLKYLLGDFDEYTSIQPTHSKYDFHHPDKPIITVLVVILNERIKKVYSIHENSLLGTRGKLAGSCTTFYTKVKKKGWENEECRKFTLKSILEDIVGRPITGWEGRQRTTIQRCDSGFFNEIQISG